MPDNETIKSEGRVTNPKIENLVLSYSFHKYLPPIKKSYFL
jgi:hypothetical protein